MERGRWSSIMTPTPCTAVPENARPGQYYPNATAANTTCPDTLKVALPIQV